ncbi:hypothetical protein Vadar_001674 [Vaccinium darrowii]|uniref:Uncharacterized protein n=1 Tax=Vaccinium darrowii TaxID=229202 RepID=A0ACB7WX46_9ERIC|nr:hypothetical protein Vadar_001674 [Vaccinium darrowii]
MGVVLIQPAFAGKELIGAENADVDRRARVEKLWRFACPTTTGLDDPLINPVMDSKFSSLGCAKILVVVAGADFFKDRGWFYYEKLGSSGWKGEVEIMETEGEDHIFHLKKPNCEKAKDIVTRVRISRSSYILCGNVKDYNVELHAKWFQGAQEKTPLQTKNRYHSRCGDRSNTNLPSSTPGASICPSPTSQLQTQNQGEADNNTHDEQNPNGISPDSGEWNGSEPASVQRPYLDINISVSVE